MLKKSFEKQLDKVLEIGAKYTEEREKLKTMFCDKYDKISINILLELLTNKGHPSEQQFAIRFRADYESNNYDEKEIEEFQRLFGKYRESIINDLEGSPDGEQ